MSDNDAELKASVSFEVDGAKAAAAQKAVQGIKASAEGAADAVKKVKPDASAEKGFGKARESAEKAFSAIDSARQVTEGGIMGLGQTIRNLAGQFPALMAAMGPVGLALAAFAAWKTAVDAVIDSKRKLLAMMRQIGVENTAAGIKSEAAAYESLTAAIMRNASARQQDSDIATAKDDARLRSDLAKLELQKAKDKAALNPDDQIGARDLELNYSVKRAALEEEAAARKQDRELLELKKKEADQIALSIAARETQDEQSKRFSDLSAQYLRVIDQAQKDSSWKTPLQKQRIWEAAAAETTTISALMSDATGKIKAANTDEFTANRTLVGLRAAQEINRTDRGTQGVHGNTRQINDSVSGTDIDREKNAQVDALFQDLNAASADGSAVFRNWARQQIEAKERENALTADFMQTMIRLAEANAKQIQDSAARACRL